MYVVISDFLIQIAEKLRQSQKLTVTELYQLRRATDTLLKANGYDGYRSVDLTMDAAVEMRAREAKEKYDGKEA
jgi:hypothetical protein